VRERLLRQAFEATQVSRRLFMFHAAFMHLIARPPGTSIEQVGGGREPGRVCGALVPLQSPTSSSTGLPAHAPPHAANCR
jgi:hypothetical protein